MRCTETNTRINKEMVTKMICLGFEHIGYMKFVHSDLPGIVTDLSAIAPDKIMLKLFQDFTFMGKENFKKEARKLFEPNESMFLTHKKNYGKAVNIQHEKTL